MVRALGLTLLAVPTAARLGAAYTLAGRLDDALPILERAIELIEAGQGGAETVCALTAIAEVYLRNGHITAASELASRARTQAMERLERGNEAWAAWLLGEIAARRSPSDCREAETCYRGALALAEELEMRPLQAHCHLGLGKLYRRTCRMDEARAELSVAVTMLREMGMTFWLPEAEQALAAAHG
jgi:tetratricopeptide (TPR) repeat protein